MSQRSTYLSHVHTIMHYCLCIFTYIEAPTFSDGCNRILKLPIGAQLSCKSTMIAGQNLVVPPGIRPPKMPARKGIRTQKWSNPPLCPVGGMWGMTLIGALPIVYSMVLDQMPIMHPSVVPSTKPIVCTAVVTGSQSDHGIIVYNYI